MTATTVMNSSAICLRLPITLWCLGLVLLFFTFAGTTSIYAQADAVNDVALTDEDSSGITISALINDSGPGLEITGVGTGSTQGSVQIINSGTAIRYSPNGQFETLNASQVTTDSFTYTIEDDDGETDTASVVVTILGRNDAPQITGAGPSSVNDNQASVSPFSGITISDVDSGEFLSVSISLSTSSKGNLSATSNISGSPATVTSGLAGRTFSPFENIDTPGTVSNVTFTITVQDGREDGVPVVTNNNSVLSITSINDDPVVTLTATSGIELQTGESNTLFSQGVTVSDVDANDALTRATVTILNVDANTGRVESDTFSPSPSSTSFNFIAGTEGASVDFPFDNPSELQTVTDGIEAVSYFSTADRTVEEKFVDVQIEIEDDFNGTSTDTVTVRVFTPPPRFQNIPIGQSVADNQTIDPFSALSVVASGQTIGLVLTLDDDRKGQFDDQDEITKSSSVFVSGVPSPDDGLNGEYVPDGDGNFNESGGSASLIYVDAEDRWILSPTADTGDVLLELPSTNSNSPVGPYRDPTTLNEIASVNCRYTIAATDSDSLQDILNDLTFEPAINRATSYSPPGNGDDAVLFNLEILNQFGNSFTVPVTQDISVGIFGVNNQPDITGITTTPIRIDDDETTTPFNQSLQAQIVDLDEQGLQEQILTVSIDPLQADLSLGTGAPANVALTEQETGGQPNGNYVLSSTNSNPITPAVASQALQSIVFTPTIDIPIGSSVTLNVAVAVQDALGATRTNSQTNVIVRSVNGAPQLTNVPSGTVNFSPLMDVFPFQGIGIEDEDDGQPGAEITLTVSLDNASKGNLVDTVTISGVGSFAETSPESGVYQLVLTGVDAVTNAETKLQGLRFDVNDNFSFPPSAPGGTEFAITVEDSLGNDNTESFSIIIRQDPINYLVSNRFDYNPATEAPIPGTLRHAIANANENDYITIALNQYPAILRLKAPLVIDKNLTILGPGADKFTISGDTDGNTSPDVQVFRIDAFAEISGLTVSRGTAANGGGIGVLDDGRLTLRNVAVRNCRALVYGGGVDVDGGSLDMINCLIANNMTDSSNGAGGGGVAIFTGLDCSIVNTTFSGNTQSGVSSVGGGALYVENSSAGEMEFFVRIDSCTFTGNVDLAEVDARASSIKAARFGSLVPIRNTIVADGQNKNLDVSGTSRIVSQGGNISNDRTQTILTQGGSEPEFVIIFNDPDDKREQTVTDIGLLPLADNGGPTQTHALDSGSIAIDSACAQAPFQATDQRGIWRDRDPDTGAYEADQRQQLVINEIHFEPTGAPNNAEYIEIYNPFSGATLDFVALGLELWVDGELAHDFTSTAPVAPGDGLVVTTDSSQITDVGTPIEDASEGPLNLGSEGLVEIRTAGGTVLVSAMYLGDFIDPTDVSYDPLAPQPDARFVGASIMLAPEFMGVFVPHNIVLVSGLASDVSTLTSNTSPGADKSDTPFGQDNAFPLAIADTLQISEDDITTIDVLANDLDANSLDDTLLVVDLSASQSDGTTNNSILTGFDALVTTDGSPPRGSDITYNPLVSVDLQSLPVGVELTDHFFYSILDFADQAGLTPKTPSATSEARVNVTILGVNDPPAPTADTVTTDEETILRIFGDPDLIATNTVFDTDNLYPQPREFATDPILADDSDPDSDDNSSSLNIFAVTQATAISGYSAGTGDITNVDSAQPHGLSNNATVLISGYGGSEEYNAFHTITVVDADTFSIPVAFDSSSPAENGVWAPLTSSGNLSTTSTQGAQVQLELRADRIETNIVYNPRASETLNALAQGESVTDTFWYAVSDRHSAVSLAPVSIIVDGVNDIPVAGPDPQGVSSLQPLITDILGATPTLSQIATFYSELEIEFYLLNGLASVRVRHPGDTTGEPFEITLYFTEEDQPIDIAAAELLANDTDVDTSDILTVTSVANSRESAGVSLNGTTITYDPSVSASLNALAREEMLIDTFEYTITDSSADMGMATSLVAVAVIGVNETPIARADYYEVSGQTQLTVAAPGILSNDTEFDINGNSPDDVLLALPQSGMITNVSGVTIQLDGDGGLLYDTTTSDFVLGLAEGETCLDSFDVTSIDRSYLFANNDMYKVQADSSNITLQVTANDASYTNTGETISITAVSSPTNGGTVTINEDDLSLTYSPQVNFVGDEFFTYTLEDGEGGIDLAVVRVRVTIDQLNGNLAANDDFYTAAQGVTSTLDVLANDNVLPELGSELTITQITAPPDQGGSAQIVAGAISYEPDTSFAGSYPYMESFTYQISGGGTATAEATVNVLVVDREGTLNIRDDSFTVIAGSANNSLNVTANDNLLPGNGAPLTVTNTSSPSNGSVSGSPSGSSFLYTPNAGFTGTDSFSYEANDGLGGTGTGTVTVMVGSTVVNNDFFTVAKDSTGNMLDVLANDGLSNGPQADLTLFAVSPDDVTIAIVNNQLEFTPAANFEGTRTFTYTVRNGSNEEATGSVTIVVIEEAVSANPDNYSVLRNSTNIALPVLDNDVVIGSSTEPLTILSVTPANRGGTVVVNDDGDGLVYSAASGFTGQETFTYTITDGVSGTDSATVVININNGELKANDDAFTVFFEMEMGGGNRSFTLPVLTNDGVFPNFGQTLTITGVGIDDSFEDNDPSLDGIVEVSPDGTSLTYTPVDLNFPYTEAFTYEISDGTTRRAEGTAFVTVLNRENIREMETKDDSFSVESNSTSNVLAVLENDGVKPADATAWTITSVSSTSQGGAISISGSNILYTPAADFVGTETFSYNVSDGFGGTGSASVSVKVGDVRLCDDYFAVTSDLSNISLEVMGNDFKRPLEIERTFEISAVGTPDKGGTVSIVDATEGDDSLTYSPSSTLPGGETYPYVESFSYTVADDADGFYQATVFVEVHEAGGDRDITTVFVSVAGENEIPAISGTMSGALDDKSTIMPFSGVTVIDPDEQGSQLVRLLIFLSDPSRGTLSGDGLLPGNDGTYLLEGTAAEVTAALQGLTFTPAENVSAAGATDTLTFEIQLDDNVATPSVTDDATTLDITGVNDPPVISGTRADLLVRATQSILPFATVTVTDPDPSQIITLTITLDNVNAGTLANLGGFTESAPDSGIFSQTATLDVLLPELRALEFQSIDAPGENVNFTLSVDDGVAAAVVDTNTLVSVLAPLVQTVAGSVPVASRDGMGFSLAIAQDTAVVGAFGSDAAGVNRGEVFVLARESGRNEPFALQATLRPTGPVTNDYFGISCALDGDTLAVGASGDPTNGSFAGAVYVFERNLGGENNWGLRTKIVPPVIGTEDEFGWSVALSGDNLIVGVPGEAGGTGAAFVFNRNQGSPDGWGQVQVISHPQPNTLDEFGSSVEIQDDLAVVGAIREGSTLGTRTGAVYIFRETAPGVWTQIQRLTPSAPFANDDFYGVSVALDGTTLVVGAPLNDTRATNEGLVYIYEFDGSVFGSEVKVQRAANLGQSVFGFGATVDLDVDTLAIGGPLVTATGRVADIYIHGRDAVSPGTWGLLESIQEFESPAQQFLFGAKVAIFKDTLLVGIDNAQNRNSVMDGNAAIYELTFTNAPGALVSLQQQCVIAEQTFSYTVTSDDFGDPDLGDIEVISVANAAGGSLPSWLSYDSNSLTLSGIPTNADVGFVEVDITVTDRDDFTATYRLSIEVKPGGPFLACGQLNASTSWQTVSLPRTYISPVVVVTPQYSNSTPPVVPRVRNAAGSSFEVKLDRTDGLTASVTGVPVEYVVVEAGTYNVADHGVKLEANTFNSTVTDSAGNWNGQSIALDNTYDQPVILGQVMSFNDVDFSSFWARGVDRFTSPSNAFIFAGKHVGEDPDTTRADETIGYIVLDQESGSIRSVDGVRGFVTGIVQTGFAELVPVPPLDFNSLSISSQDTDAGTSFVFDSGHTLGIAGNADKAVSVSNTLQANTVLEFDFMGLNPGSNHALGFDNDSTTTFGQAFQIFGTASGAIQDFNDYPGDGKYQSYSIPAGDYFTGPFDRLTVQALDGMDDPTIFHSFFRNVVVRAGTLRPYVQPVSGLRNADCAILSMQAMPVNDGGWPVLHAPNAFTGDSITLAVDEDQLSDAERAHGPQQVGFLILGEPNAGVPLFAPMDISGTGFANWVNLNSPGNADDILNSPDQGVSNDDEKDGSYLLSEYGSGGSADGFDEPFLTVEINASGNLVATYRRRIDDLRLSIDLLRSTSMGNFVSAGSDGEVIGTVITPVDSSFEDVSVEFDASILPTDEIYLILCYTYDFNE